MLIALTHNSHEARVWLDELPDMTYAVVDMLRQSAGVRTEGMAEPRSCAVEVLLRGLEARYSLLGAHFTSAATDELVVEIALSSREDDGQEQAPPADRIRAGFTQVRHAVPLLARVLALRDLARLGPGVLRFDRAAPMSQ